MFLTRRNKNRLLKLLFPALVAVFMSLSFCILSPPNVRAATTCGSYDSRFKAIESSPVGQSTWASIRDGATQEFGFKIKNTGSSSWAATASGGGSTLAVRLHNYKAIRNTTRVYFTNRPSMTPNLSNINPVFGNNALVPIDSNLTNSCASANASLSVFGSETPTGTIAVNSTWDHSFSWTPDSSDLGWHSILATIRTSDGTNSYENPGYPISGYGEMGNWLLNTTVVPYDGWAPNSTHPCKAVKNDGNAVNCSTPSFDGDLRGLTLPSISLKYKNGSGTDAYVSTSGTSTVSVSAGSQAVTFSATGTAYRGSLRNYFRYNRNSSGIMENISNKDVTGSTLGNTGNNPASWGISISAGDTVEFCAQSKDTPGDISNWNCMTVVFQGPGGGPSECKPGIPVGDPRCNPPPECKPGIPVGDPRCKTYILTPHVSVTPSIIESGSPLTVSSSISKSGNDATNPFSWSLTSDYGNFAHLGSVASLHVSLLTNPTFTYTETDNLPVGARVCFFMSVKPFNEDPNSGPYIPPAKACAVIAKKPKVQIWGGDLLVGGVVKTSTTVKNGTTYGSWTEYGIVAGGVITGAGSGSAYNLGMPGATTCKASRLSFSNATSSSCIATTVIGKYTNASSIPNISASFPTSASTTNFSSGSIDGKQGLYKVSGNVTITGGNIAKGQWVVINATGSTVSIAGNINYTNGTLNRISDIPQVVIIADSIVISGGATNVDAWLIARNSISTCHTVGNTIITCANKLTVNGPVMTNKLYLYRTAGAETGATGDPAEIFNLRADAYLWAFGRATGSGRVKSVYVTELPPRF